ncbi:MAG: homocysteine S-methyltransferase family protein, partial [Rhodospirillaceae bacterium]
MHATKYRTNLPQTNGRLLLADGGIETVMVFQEGVDLPCFAAFALLRTAAGRDRLRAYHRRYIDIARRDGLGVLLESATWRASAGWGAKLGLAADEIAAVNRDAVAFLADLRAAEETDAMPMVISGCVGPRGDGYDPGAPMTEAEAETYHAHQIGTLAGTAADMISALTMNNVAEATGAVRAAMAAAMPIAVSFTVETDGRLPTGQSLGDAVAQVDAATDGYPAYYMINCAHPTHFAHVLAGIGRIRGLRANASRCSHAELDNSETLDDGDPVELGRQFGDLVRANRRLTVLGGCCGTDHRHVGEISAAVRAMGLSGGLSGDHGA